MPMLARCTGVAYQFELPEVRQHFKITANVQQYYARLRWVNKVRRAKNTIPVYMPHWSHAFTVLGIVQSALC